MEEPGISTALHSKAYLSLLLTSGLLGLPLSVAAFCFLVVVHQLEQVVWHDLPELVGHDQPPAWWPILALGVAGVLVALAVTRLPGHGGHVPVDGLGAGATPPSHVPGVVLAAGASLVGGAVVGPEAPLIAIGGGLALLAIRRTRLGADPTSATLIAAAGSAAAISAIFGNPLVAAVLYLEVLGLARRQLMLVVLPCLLSSGVGALLFTGLGEWTGLEIGALAIGSLSPTRLALAEVLIAVPLALVVAVGTWVVFAGGRWTARLAQERSVTTTIAAGLLAGTAACVYALLSDRSPAEAALSGQAMLPVIATPGALSTGALVALLVCKAIAYALCLGTFRGGPVFPALFLGGVVGVLAAELVPGLDLLPALAIGMAAGVAVTGLAVTSVVLVVLLLGDSAASQMPVVIIAVVVALVTEELLTTRRRSPDQPRTETP